MNWNFIFGIAISAIGFAIAIIAGKIGENPKTPLKITYVFLIFRVIGIAILLAGIFSLITNWTSEIPWIPQIDPWPISPPGEMGFFIILFFVSIY